MMALRIGSLFSGIGGLELGLEWAGLGRTVWQVEQDAFCLGVLAKHWPKARRYTDVRQVGAHLAPVDLICGGFPCQDVSSAGKRAGLGGAQSGLWYEFARVTGECRPEWLVIENVASGAKRWVDAVQGDLRRLGYASLPIPIGARDVGAPHRRNRIFIVGHRMLQGLQGAEAEGAEGARSADAGSRLARGVPDRDGLAVRKHQQRRSSGRSRGVSNEGDAEPRHRGEGLAHGRRHRSGVERKGHHARRREEHHEAWHELDGRHARVAHVFPPARTDFEGWEAYLRAGGPQPGILRSADGLPPRVARRRIAALGNAVVPQDAEVIGHVIRQLARAAYDRTLFQEGQWTC